MKPLRSLVLLCVFLISIPVLALANPGMLTGKVAEAITAGGYVYIKLEEQGTWLATNAFEVSVGDSIQYSDGAEMKDFHSKALDRTFESIIFASSASVLGGESAAENAGAAKPLSEPVAALAPSVGEITPLEDGKTVAAVFAESSDLDQQVISVNARVIKVSKNIMGKNWITLQDGSGEAPDDKLLATSQELVSPGDLVIAKGKVATGVDLGHGYKYKVLLEETVFSEGVK